MCFIRLSHHGILAGVLAFRYFVVDCHKKNNWKPLPPPSPEGRGLSVIAGGESLVNRFRLIISGVRTGLALPSSRRVTSVRGFPSHPSLGRRGMSVGCDDCRFIGTKEFLFNVAGGRLLPLISSAKLLQRLLALIVTDNY